MSRFAKQVSEYMQIKKKRHVVVWYGNWEVRKKARAPRPMSRHREPGGSASLSVCRLSVRQSRNSSDTEGLVVSKLEHRLILLGRGDCQSGIEFNLSAIAPYTSDPPK